jgi:hypothetical protein
MNRVTRRLAILPGVLLIALALALALHGEERGRAWEKISPYFSPPAEHANERGPYRPPLLFADGSPVKTPEDWARRRKEILDHWHGVMGAWPPLIERPTIETIEETRRENFTQKKVRVRVAPEETVEGYLLIPDGAERSPAVFVPFYEPLTSIGQKEKGEPLLAFGYELAKRGFVTLSIGSPGGGDAWKPNVPGGAQVLQPLSYLGYVAANGYNALATLPEVDPARVGIVGHSYGGKWAMFGSCLYDKYAAAAWSDGGIVWDEARSNVNFWEPWYLGREPEGGVTRKPGIPTPENPRTGAYKQLIESGHDLHELHALMAPRPFLVSGGSEDPPERWAVLNHSVEVNKLLGFENRVGMTNRPGHTPTPESNEVLYAFFEHFLMGK